MSKWTILAGILVLLPTVASHAGQTKAGHVLALQTVPVVSFIPAVRSTQSLPQSILQETADRLALGKGFDPLTGEVHDVPCVTVPNEPPQTPGSGRTVLSGTVTTSYKKLATSASFSLAASFGAGIYSASADYKAMQSKEISAYSEYAIIEASYRSNPVQLPLSIRLTDRARRLINQKNYMEFQAECGDEFVSGVRYGADYQVRLSVSASSSNEQSSAATTLAAAASGLFISGGLSVANKDSFSQILSSSTTSLSTVYVGDDPSTYVDGQSIAKKNCGPTALTRLPTKKIDEMYGFAATLSCRTKEQPTPVDFIMMPYKELDPRAPAPGPSQDIGISYLMSLYDRWAGLAYMLEHSAEFGPFIRGPAQDEVQRLSELISSLNQNYQTAVASPRPELMAQLLAELRARIPVMRPPHRLVMYDNDSLVKSNNWHQVGDFVGDEYPTYVMVKGGWGLDSPVTVTCPDHCIRPNQFEFLDINHDGTPIIVSPPDSTPHEAFKIPPNHFVYFRIYDTRYDDNIWPQGSGVEIYEQYQPSTDN